MDAHRIERRDTGLHVLLDTDLTAAALPGLQPALRAELDREPANVVFDFASTQMLDSSGIGLLIATSNSVARQGHRVSLVNVPGPILQLLQSMRLVARLNASGRTQ